MRPFAVRFVAYRMLIYHAFDVNLELLKIILMILFVSFNNVSYLCKRYMRQVRRCCRIFADKSVTYEKH
jgi:hypothetical protein